MRKDDDVFYVVFGYVLGIEICLGGNIGIDVDGCLIGVILSREFCVV